MDELRLGCVQFMRDAHSSLGDEDAKILINDSNTIWEKHSNSNRVEA